MKLMKQLLLLVFCTGVFGWQVTAQTAAVKSADPRLAKALGETKTEFQLSSRDGRYTVVFETENKRNQKVHLISETSKINGVEMRLVFSYAVIADKPPSPQTAGVLLEQNMDSISTWAVVKLDDGNYAIVNKLYIPADFDGKKLQMALSEIVLLADNLEERLTKKDQN